MVKCEQCGKGMPTEKILEQHVIKRHGGISNEVVTVIKPDEELKVVEIDQTVSTPEPQKVKSDMVELVSADGRELEVAVGSTTWKGKVISFPRTMQFTDKEGNITNVDMEEEIRRLLETGGYFLKD